MNALTILVVDLLIESKVLKIFLFLLNLKVLNLFALIGIMSVYAISLLTDRKLVIKFTKPCNLEKYLEPNQVNWLIDIPSNLTKKLISLNWIGKINESDLVKINFLTYYKDTDVLVIRESQHLMKHLTGNPNHHEKIKQLGYTLENFNIESVLPIWYRKLFKFTPSMQLKFNEKLNQVKPTKNSKLICAQVRTGGGYDHPFMQYKNVYLYWKLIKEKFINNQTYDYRVFITSDNPNVINEAYQEFEKGKLVGFKENSFHINTNNNCNDIGNLILDFNLLGNCDMGIVSKSGFGMIGIISNPHFVEKNFYLYIDQSIKLKFFVNKNLSTIYDSFYQFNYSLLYYEFV